VRFGGTSSSDLYHYTGNTFIKQNEGAVSFAASPVYARLFVSSINFPGEETESSIGTIVTTSTYSGHFGATPHVGAFDGSKKNWEFVSKAGFSGVVNAVAGASALQPILILLFGALLLASLL